MSRHIWATFCDDIRQEVGNKYSLMGIYGPQLFVPRFPTTLPKFVVAVSAVTPSSRPFESLVFRVTQDNSVIAESMIDIDELRSQMATTPPSNETNGFHVVSTFFMFSPLQIEDTCKLSPLLLTESEELKGPTLRIQLLPEGS